MSGRDSHTLPISETIYLYENDIVTQNSKNLQIRHYVSATYDKETILDLFPLAHETGDVSILRALLINIKLTIYRIKIDVNVICNSHNKYIKVSASSACNMQNIT